MTATSTGRLEGVDGVRVIYEYAPQSILCFTTVHRYCYDYQNSRSESVIVLRGTQADTDDEVPPIELTNARPNFGP